jgi:hypothetical protein
LPCVAPRQAARSVTFPLPMRNPTSEGRVCVECAAVRLQLLHARVRTCVGETREPARPRRRQCQLVVQAP